MTYNLRGSSLCFSRTKHKMKMNKRSNTHLMLESIEKKKKQSGVNQIKITKLKELLLVYSIFEFLGIIIQLEK